MLDRTLQREILRALAQQYPRGLRPIKPNIRSGGVADEAILATVFYLAEHGLITSGFTTIDTFDGPHIAETGQTTITAKGLDFLADDGGLSAILNVVTVKIDAQQLAELLAAKVEKLEGVSHEERSQIASTLRKLPAKAIETVSEKLLGWAVDHAQDALPQLRMWIALASESLGA